MGTLSVVLNITIQSHSCNLHSWILFQWILTECHQGRWSQCWNRQFLTAKSCNESHYFIAMQDSTTALNEAVLSGHSEVVSMLVKAHSRSIKKVFMWHNMISKAVCSAQYVKTATVCWINKLSIFFWLGIQQWCVVTWFCCTRIEAFILARLQKRCEDW